jgi:hypothetical protein
LKARYLRCSLTWTTSRIPARKKLTSSSSYRMKQGRGRRNHLPLPTYRADRGRYCASGFVINSYLILVTLHAVVHCGGIFVCDPDKEG